MEVTQVPIKRRMLSEQWHVYMLFSLEKDWNTGTWGATRMNFEEITRDETLSGYIYMKSKQGWRDSSISKVPAVQA